MSKKSAVILLIFASILTASMIGAGVWAYTSQHRYINEKTLTLGDNMQEELQVALGGFTPGTSQAYTLNLRAHTGDRYHLNLDFQKTGDDSLADFIHVEIFVGDASMGSCKLSALLNGESFDFPIYFDSNAQIDAKIVYHMYSDVGDEAQGTRADFNIILTSKR